LRNQKVSSLGGEITFIKSLYRKEKMKAAPVIQEVVINASAAVVWKAITDKNEMKHWYFDLEEFKPEVGFEFQFYGGREELFASM
jgi:uncharacterized protein YndB with AHSA1/START domain